MLVTYFQSNFPPTAAGMRCGRMAIPLVARVEAAGQPGRAVGRAGTRPPRVLHLQLCEAAGCAQLVRTFADASGSENLKADTKSKQIIIIIIHVLRSHFGSSLCRLHRFVWLPSVVDRFCRCHALFDGARS